MALSKLVIEADGKQHAGKKFGRRQGVPAAELTHKIKLSRSET
jgi:hypothetical protein